MHGSCFLYHRIQVYLKVVCGPPCQMLLKNPVSGGLFDDCCSVIWLFPPWYSDELGFGRVFLTEAMLISHKYLMFIKVFHDGVKDSVKDTEVIKLSINWQALISGNIDCLFSESPSSVLVWHINDAIMMIIY